MANITKIYLLKVPLENDYKHTIYFEDPQTQHDYFLSKTVNSYEGCSYQRKDNKIRVPEQFDTVYRCNYVMYQNLEYDGKWFHAFITDVQYINDGLTEIYIETDVMQTWRWVYSLKECFVEREHTKNDGRGLNTVPEGLETGEYICNELDRDLELRDYTYILCATENVANPDNKTYGTNFGGVWSAGGAWVSDNITTLISLIREYDISEDVSGDAITNFYMVPKKIVNNSSGTLQFSGQTAPVVYEHTTSKQNTLNGYSPKNAKLLCYPYNYLLLSNNSGSSNVLRYEDFSTSNCKFEIEGVPTVGGSIKCVPMNYKGLDKIQEEGIMCGKFPVLSWSTDIYTNWLTQNAVNNTVGFAADGLQIIGGAVMAAGSGGLAAGVGGGMLASGVSGIVNRLTQMHQQSFTPSSARGNINSGDINTCHKMNTFYFYKMSIKKEYAMIIDDFFTMFGYKVNRVKKPEENHRKRFWYTKTIDCDINAELPQKDIQTIKNCYNNGITFWKDPDDIGNYTDDNSTK